MAFIGPISPGENPLYMKDGVVMQIAKQDIGSGDLVITERAFMWKPADRNEGISIPWTSVSLHAVTSEPRSVYLQLDFRLQWPSVYEGNLVPPQNGNGHADEGTGDDEDEGNVSDSSDEVATEIHIIPQDLNDINQIFYAMNHCQEMNPDPNADSMSEEGDFMEAEGDEDDSDGGEGEMRNLHLNDNQFADD